MDNFSFLIFLGITLVSITLHEYSHGWVAYKLGDPTAKLAGRLTLNPFAHIVPFGTIILPLVLMLIPGILPFGYAKPVPINPRHFKNPKKDFMWVGLAGPTANLCIAFLLSLLLRIIANPFIFDILLWGVIINLVLTFFNIFPIPPLDGSRVMASFLPGRLSYTYLRAQFYGFIFIIILVNLGFFKWYIIPITRLTFSIFGIASYYPF